MYDRKRRRRIIYNDDGDQRSVANVARYGYRIEDADSLINARTRPVFDTQVDTYVLCVGNGCDPPWGGTEPIHPFLGTAQKANNLIVEACHRHDLEIWASLRMNDIHDSFIRPPDLAKTADPLKAAHPEYLLADTANSDLPGDIAERYFWTAFNFSRPEVRKHRLDFIAANAAECDWDGYEFDFTRFAWCFSLGDEHKHLGDMTELVRKTRALLNEIGRQRGRPLTFAVHVHDSIRMSLQLGLDVEGWLKEDLVDVLVVGLGYCPYLVRMREWLALAGKYRVQVYPSVNTNMYVNWQERLGGGPVVHQALRASSAYYWNAGADGMYLFNLFCQNEGNPEVKSEYIYAPLKEIGEPERLKGKAKLYTISPVSDSGFCLHGTEETPLPIALDRVERKLTLEMGPDAGDPKASFKIRILAAGGDPGVKVRLRLNHKLVTAELERNGSGYEADVPPCVLRTGRNELALWSDQDLTGAVSPVIIYQVFLSVAY